MLKRRKTTTILLILLSILALFSNVFMHATWIGPLEFTYVETLITLVKLFRGENIKVANTIAQTLNTITITSLIAFPFCYHKIKKFFKWLLIVGIMLLIVQYVMLNVFSLVFIPFLIIWYITLIHIKKSESLDF